MEYIIIQSPSESALDIILRRASKKIDKDTKTHAVGLIQGRLIDMVVAADIAEKCANVNVCDVKGTCPQNMIMLAILGDTSAVHNAINAVKKARGDGNA